MKYFFEAGMGSGSPSPRGQGSDPGQTSEAMKMLLEN